MNVLVTAPGLTSRQRARDEPLRMTSGRQVGYDMVALGAGVAVVGLVTALILARGFNVRCAAAPPGDNRKDRSSAPGSGAPGAAVIAARRLNRAAGMLAFSVLADSAIEHYRGSFSNRVMYTPIVVSLITLAISAHGVADQRRGAHVVRDGSYAAAALTGLAGTGFHIYNVASRPGGLNWGNAFYGAPLGAPSAILLAGLLGFMAERVRSARQGEPPRLLGLPAGRVTAAVTAAGLLGTAAEAGFLHFRGAYHNPFMFVPVTVPPAAAVVMAEMAFGKPLRNRALSRWWLRLTTAVGFAGVAFHAYGVHRNMGGWRNWRQNLLNGPPLPAPPSFAGLALAGLAALALIEGKPDA